jgi:hypothetical protein
MKEAAQQRRPFLQVATSNTTVRPTKAKYPANTDATHIFSNIAIPVLPMRRAMATNYISPTRRCRFGARHWNFAHEVSLAGAISRPRLSVTCLNRPRCSSRRRPLCSALRTQAGHRATSEKCQRTNPLSREVLAARSGVLRLPR